ncbi:DNA repair protein RadC [Pelagibius sp.]|uniref:RadC family protein n=1 Tax=Pelagibius sp. TaxID=1931238 RepID=UPI00260FF16D|nr:DNA repair protein RadC [Pelagibius sp.]
MSGKEEDHKPHYHGHRDRLRDRLLTRGGDSLSDYEVLEFLLFGAQPRGDTKPLAKTLLAEFGSLSGVLTASPEALARVPGMGKVSVAALSIVPEAAARLAREQMIEAPEISAWDKLLDYCRITMAHEPVEQFRLLFLDKRNRVIADEVQQQGTIDHTPVYTREVVKRALELGAAALILVHNHPSGEPQPSAADIAMTEELREAAEKLGIVIHDHLVIGRGGHASFRAMGLL